MQRGGRGFRGHSRGAWARCGPGTFHKSSNIKNIPAYNDFSHFVLLFEYERSAEGGEKTKTSIINAQKALKPIFSFPSNCIPWLHLD